MKIKSLIVNVIFFGAIWGLLEATLGYALHFLPALIAGGMMFPLGALLMYWAYRNTGSKGAIIYVALIAAAIKAVNFLMPGLPALKIYNPMVAIILQGLVVLAAVALFEKRSFPVQVAGALSTSFAWRGLFIVNQVINHAITGIVHGQLASATTVLTFIFVSALFEAALVTILYVSKSALSRRASWRFSPHWLMSASALAAAIACVIIL